MLSLSLGGVFLSIETEHLIDEYEQSLRKVRKALRSARQRCDDNPRDRRAENDRQHLASMERDLLWSLEYMETGRVPDNHRGAYRWTVPMDPRALDQTMKTRTKGSTTSDWFSWEPYLDKLLKILTPREREAFILVRGQGVSFRQTAFYMQVRSPGTVSNLVRRAERKIRRKIIGYRPDSARF